MSTDDLTHYMQATSRMRERAERAEAALARVTEERDQLWVAANALIELKDGPRGPMYEHLKPHCWESLRAAVGTTPEAPCTNDSLIATSQTENRSSVNMRPSEDPYAKAERFAGYTAQLAAAATPEPPIDTLRLPIDFDTADDPR